jgi:hypothetical protein
MTIAHSVGQNPINLNTSLSCFKMTLNMTDVLLSMDFGHFGANRKTLSKMTRLFKDEFSQTLNFYILHNIPY